MMHHMIACYENTTHVVPYTHFLSKVFKEVGIDLFRERDIDVLSIYDTYNTFSIE